MLVWYHGAQAETVDQHDLFDNADLQAFIVLSSTQAQDVLLTCVFGFITAIFKVIFGLSFLLFGYLKVCGHIFMAYVNAFTDAGPIYRLKN